MEVVFECSHCHATIEAHSDISGVRAECPNCNEVVLVPAPGIEIGMELGGFKIEKKLGVGGMGEVFKATQVAMDRPVALKILPPALTGDEKTVERFLHEVRMAAKLEHPNIVTAFDAGKASGYHYLAMSIVNGEDLSDRLKREKRLSEDTSIAIVDKIAHALDYAWTKFQLLHRDIKPANIMITVDNEVKLMDMGIAKSLEEDSNLTMQGMLVGTPFYMSPEQATGSKDIDCRSDIYSLGATLYHLVTGKRPFSGPNAMSVIAKHLSETPPDPKSINAELSDDCCALIRKMMARDRMDRFENWQLLREAVARMRSGETLTDTHAPTQISGGMIAPVAAISNISDDTALNLGTDDTIGLKGTNHTVAKAPPRLATTLEMQGSAAQAQPGQAMNDPMIPPALDSGTQILEGGRDAMDVKGVKTGVFMAAAMGVLMIGILVGVIIWIATRVQADKVDNTLKKGKEKLVEREIEGEIAAGIADYKELEYDRSDLKEMMRMARAFTKSNPNEFEEAIRKFEKVKKYADKLDLKKFSMEAETEIDRIKGTRRAVIVDNDNRKKAEAASRVMSSLTNVGDFLARELQFAPAAYNIKNYDGLMAEETKAEREALAQKYMTEYKRIEPGIEFQRKVLRAYVAGDDRQVRQLLENGRQPRTSGMDRRLMDEAVMPLLPIFGEDNRFRPPNNRDRDRRFRPKNDGKFIPGGLLGKAVRLYKEHKYLIALKVAQESRVTLFRQVIIGEILTSVLKGRWESTKFSGTGYKRQVEKMVLTFDGTTATTYYDGKNRGAGQLVLFANWIYYNRGGKMKYWAVTPSADGSFSVKIAHDITAYLTRQK